MHCSVSPCMIISSEYPFLMSMQERISFDSMTRSSSETVKVLFRGARCFVWSFTFFYMIGHYVCITLLFYLQLFQDATYQSVHDDRFCYEVICASLESFYYIGIRIECREDYDRQVFC